MKAFLSAVLLVILLSLVWPGNGVALAAPIVSVDDAGHRFSFERPPTRLIALAPSLTELVFAAGGGAALVGTSAFSDHPAAARDIARVGDVARLDIERIVALKPDLVLVWNRGNTNRGLDQLAAAGLRLYRLEPQRLDEVSRALERLGVVLGHQPVAERAARQLRASIAALRQRYAKAPSVRVFYQAWASPLMTIGGSQLIDEVIELCGGRNVFVGLPALAPLVSFESVVAADPEAIVGADRLIVTGHWRRAVDAPAFVSWQRFAGIAAVKHGWLFEIDGDFIARQGPRIGEGAAAMCEALDLVRRER